MKTEIEVKIGSTVYDRINMVRMSDAERLTAVHAMKNADAIVDSVLWAIQKIEQIGAALFLKPSIKH
jgi:hypothetical protein